MIFPTIGRVVWYWPQPLAKEEGEQPHAATVCYVHNDRLVNLSVVNAYGSQYAATSVVLRQEGDPPPPSPYCEWMPYQKGQAAKTEALEAAVGGIAPPA